MDDYSRYYRVFQLSLRMRLYRYSWYIRQKSKINWTEKIKRLRSDRGREYGSDLLKDLCEKEGIIYEVSAPYTHQQNGIA